jgi:hypothetical protein
LFDTTNEVLDLINVIAKKVSDEPFLIKVFLTRQGDIDDQTEVSCLPFQIL